LLASSQTPRLEDQDISVSPLPFVLTGMGDPASSYATSGIALRILEALKPPHPDLPILRQGGDVIKGGKFTVHL